MADTDAYDMADPPLNIGKGCPPSGGRRTCTIRGQYDSMRDNYAVNALLKDDEDNVIATAKFTISDDFIDDAKSAMPEGLYSWYPKYAGGDISLPEKIESCRGKFPQLFQDWLCNYAHAQLVLDVLLDPSTDKKEYVIQTEDIDTIFALSNKLPTEEDFLGKVQKLVRSGHMEFVKQILSPHIALYYGIRHKQAASFMQLLEQRELITTNKRAGYQVPYGSGNTQDAFGIRDVSKAGLEYSTGAGKPAKPRCFVIMPFSGVTHQYGVLVAAWKDTFGDDAEIFHQDDDPDKGAGELLDDKIMRNIRDASVVVAILSMGEKERALYEAVDAEQKSEVLKKAFPLNTNVLIELGYALRASQDDSCRCKDIILLAESPQPFDYLKNVFDVSNRKFIPYTTGESGDADLREELGDILEFMRDKYELS